MGSNFGAAGGLAALPLALNPFREKDPSKYTEKDLEKAADKQAEQAAKKFKQDKVQYTVELDKSPPKIL